MFETLQIARRHLLRFEYPELAKSKRFNSGVISRSLLSWVENRGRQAQTYQYRSKKPFGEHDEYDDEEVIVAFWPFYPHF